MHELAKELGLTNKETLDLCETLGIGVKTHSSSIEDAQADRSAQAVAAPVAVVAARVSIDRPPPDDHRTAHHTTPDPSPRRSWPVLWRP